MNSMTFYLDASFSANEAVQVAALVAVLKAARALGLVDTLDEVRLPGTAPLALPEVLLQSAVASADEGLAIDAVQMACTHQKSVVLPCAGPIDPPPLHPAWVLPVHRTSSVLSCSATTDCVYQPRTYKTKAFCVHVSLQSGQPPVVLSCPHRCDADWRAAALELRLVALGLSLGLRCGSQELQQKWRTLLSRLLRRQHLGIHGLLVRWRALAAAPPGVAPPDAAAEAAEEMEGAGSAP